MNWEAIKSIYRHVLVDNNKIEYLGEDKYKLITFYSSGKKRWEAEYQNRERHGKCISWYEGGQKWWEHEYKNNQRHGKYIGWYKNGQKTYEEEYKNGYQIK